MSTRCTCLVVASLCVLSFFVTWSPAQEEPRDLFEEAPWTLSGGGGVIMFEGDEPVKNSGFLSLKLGYDFNPRWTFEWDMNIMPVLKHREFDDGRFQLDDDTWGIRNGLDVIFHLRNTKDLHFDPYLTAGVGFTYYGEDLGSGQLVGSANAGGGLYFHFDDVWGIRADYRTSIAGQNTEFNQLASGGLVYRLNARVPVKYAVSGGEIDSDGDGLLDDDEVRIGTDPYDPDTDKDGLSDGEEVHQYKTDPLIADTDWDGLKDGAEVLTYSTDPLNRDTDNGGVTDGHEIIEDDTDPLDPSDDLQLYTLNIEFDYDKADIRPIYFEELDVIVKVLNRDPGATAKVEGHADKRPKSSKKYNKKLSERRAKAIVNYLSDVGGIDRSRLMYEGYGFSRPVAPNDTEENMQKNRRTEIYIRSEKDKTADEVVEVQEEVTEETSTIK